MNERRLIDANALMQSLGITDMDCVKCAWYSKATRRCKRGGDFEDACCAIENAPTIEPKKGKWIRESLVTNYPYKCSACKKYTRAMYDFCPNCGARMVQKGEDSGQK